MAKVLIADIDGKEYKFGLDRKQIVRAEEMGFNIKEIEDKPVKQLSLFWAVGLNKYHPELKIDESYELFDKFLQEGGDLEDIIKFLSEEYTAFLQTTPSNSKKTKKTRVETI